MKGFGCVNTEEDGGKKTPNSDGFINPSLLGMHKSYD